MSTVASRLAGVERQLRFHRTIIVGLLVVLVALVGYGAMEGAPEVVRATRFEAIDPNGTIGSTLDAGGLEVTKVESSLFNKDEPIMVKAVVRASFVQAERLEAVNKKGMVGAVLTIFGLEVKDVFNDKPMIWLRSDRGEGPTLSLFTDGRGGPKGERMRVEIMARGQDDPGAWMNMTNKQGDVVVQILVDEHLMGRMGVWDRDGKGRTLTPR